MEENSEKLNNIDEILKYDETSEKPSKLQEELSLSEEWEKMASVIFRILQVKPSIM